MTTVIKITKLLLVVVLLGLFGYYLLLKSTEVRIQKEQHITAIYSEYKNNMDACKQQAKELEKDDQFIKANCIKALNTSLLGEWLKGWGRHNLLINE